MNIIKRLILFTLIIGSISSSAREYFIFSVMHDLPMSNDIKSIKKNYYINLGKKQGVKNGTVLNVYRTVEQNDPYETSKRYDYNIKIGELEVVHNDKDSSIAISKSLVSGEDKPFFEIPNFMVGDAVAVQIN